MPVRFMGLVPIFFPPLVQVNVLVFVLRVLADRDPLSSAPALQLCHGFELHGVSAGELPRDRARPRLGPTFQRL